MQSGRNGLTANLGLTLLPREAELVGGPVPPAVVGAVLLAVVVVVHLVVHAAVAAVAAIAAALGLRSERGGKSKFASRLGCFKVGTKFIFLTLMKEC